MDYQLISETKPKARKEYACVWCVEKIKKGEIHVHETSTYCGDFQDHRWHPECKEAAARYFTESHESEFLPNAYKRGSNEEAA